MLSSVDLSKIFGLPELADDDVEQLRGHVAQLAADLGVERREKGIFFLEADGDTGEGWFASPTVRTEFDYLVGLHEAGRHALGLRTFESDGESVIIDNEVAVWQWLRENARITVSDQAWRACIRCLHTHEGQTPRARCLAVMRDLAQDEAPMWWR
jgi:hypothetical protein